MREPQDEVGRRFWRSQWRFVAVVGFLVAMVANWIGTPQLALAAGNPPPSFGLDISWPQCKTGIPTPASGRTITIIGVTGGKAFTQNPCFATEYRWSVDQGHIPAFYMNLNAPSRSTANRGQIGPRGKCRPGDASCVGFNYGYNAAQDAVNYARSINAHSSTWWLDVETVNYWSKDRFLNARVIRGAIRFFQDQEIVVGIYSIAPMWWEIAGDLRLGLPTWVAQTNVNVPATAYCSPAYEFGGGRTTMVQSWNGQYDVDYGCPPSNFAIRAPAAPAEIDGSAAAPIPLATTTDGMLAASPGGTARYFTLPNPASGAQRLVTASFWPHGPDVANGFYVSLFQDGKELARVQASNATTPGYVTLSFSSKNADPFVIQLMNYNDASATPISYTMTGS